MGDDQLHLFILEIGFQPVREGLRGGHIAGYIAQPDGVAAQGFGRPPVLLQKGSEVCLLGFLRCVWILQPSLGHMDKGAVGALFRVFQHQGPAHELRVQRMGADTDDSF